MSTDWLAVQSFQRTQELLTAINTLSIHTKLELAGIADDERAEAAAKAREKLALFLKAFDKIVREAEQTNGETLLGIDPRMEQLARKFVAARRDRARFHSPLFTQSLSEAANLLAPTEAKDRQALVEYLQDLRTLVEEHLHADIHQILHQF